LKELADVQDSKNKLNKELSSVKKERYSQDIELNKLKMEM
jgi:hypothetical protein